MNGLARILPYALSFFSSLCIMVLELVASRLVARHVGGSLIVWTSVIGIMLGGICLGNVLGGRLADRVEPRRAIGPLYALGSLMTLLCLWVNSVVGLTPGLGSMPWDLRTVLIVSLDFLVPATVLGMIGPVVAKMAVEQSQKSGSALGDVYMMGAVGSIVGTFIAGYYLIYEARTSTIVTIVAAAYALLAAALLIERAGRVLALVTAVVLGLGAVVTATQQQGTLPGIPLESVGRTAAAYVGQGLCLAGNALALVLAAMTIGKLRSPREEPQVDASDLAAEEGMPRTSLRDLAVLAFLASLAFMALEMTAGRLVQRHLGSSVYGWTSVIGVLLGGLSLGNYLGGKIADHVHNEKQASWLFLAASFMTVLILLAERPPGWLVRNPIEHFVLRASVKSCPSCGEPLKPAITSTTDCPSCGRTIEVPKANPGRSFFGGETLLYDSQGRLVSAPEPALSQAISMSGYPWWFRVLFWTAAVFFVPSVTMGTVSPVVAKLAVDRLRRIKRTGTAIGAVYAWGMVGSILGTFLTGFVLIDHLGTKGMILGVATLMALAATSLGSVTHALWAGVPLGLCIIAFAPVGWLENRVLPGLEKRGPAPLAFLARGAVSLGRQGVAWGIRDERGNPATAENELAYSDESNYYFIKVSDSTRDGKKKRTLVLDNLIHGYFFLGHPEELEYDYEHIYALVTKRSLDAKQTSKDPTAPAGTPLSTLFLGGGSYTFPRYLQHVYPGTSADVAEIDPAVTRANHAATGLPKPLPPGAPPDPGGIHTVWGDARQFVENRHRGPKKYDVIYGDAFNDFSVPWHLTTREFNEMLAGMLTDDGIFMINIIDIYKSDERARQEVEEGQKGAPEDATRAVEEARKLGGFLASWVETARSTFPYLYVFGTDTPGRGLRETFVVVASKKPIDLTELGTRKGDPNFYGDDPKLFAPYNDKQMAELKVRSRGIILTDDYAPVENLLEPVAASRGDD